MNPVRAEQRFAKSRPCPICGGWESLDRGAGKRCTGFRSSDGKYAHCSREEHAGSLPVEENDTYAHRLNGPCKCGTQHGEAAAESPQSWKVEATYEYRELGQLLYTVIRYEGKVFRQRRADGSWKLGDVKRVLYRLDELLKADPSKMVYIAEGEKDVDALCKLGVVATTNAQGAGKFHTVMDCATKALRGRTVVVCADDDLKGHEHADDVVARLSGIAGSVRKIVFPGAKDAYEWISKGGTVEQLESIQSSPGKPPRFEIVRANAEWVTKKLPPREHLFVDMRTQRGAIDQAGTWLAAGPGGAGKSYLTIGMALSVANGSTWLGTFAPSKSGRTLIIAAEDSAEDIQRRAYAIASAEGLSPVAMDRFDVLPISNRVTSLVAASGDTFSPSDDATTLCAQIADGEPYDLVIVDPYGRIAGVSVDADNAAAAATISALSMIASAARGLVLGVTHTSLRSRIAASNGAAEGATGVRGATGQTDYARGVLRLEKDNDAIWLSLAKANHVAPWEPVGLRRGDHGELIAMEAADVAEIKASKSSDAKSAKKEREARERDRLDDVAAREAIAKHPELPVRDLVAIVRGVRSCGGDRAHAAVSRVRHA